MYFFIIGLVSGIGVGLAVAACLLRDPEEQLCPDEEGAADPALTGSQWAQTRNFLYYDGTEMPIVKRDKEDTNEQ